jgi:hypothetical protein
MCTESSYLPLYTALCTIFFFYLNVLNWWKGNYRFILMRKYISEKINISNNIKDISRNETTKIFW